MIAQAKCGSAGVQLGREALSGARWVGEGWKAEGHGQHLKGWPDCGVSLYFPSLFPASSFPATLTLVPMLQVK